MLCITLCLALSQRKLETQWLKHRKGSYTFFSYVRHCVDRESKAAMVEARQDHQGFKLLFPILPSSACGLHPHDCINGVSLSRHHILILRGKKWKDPEAFLIRLCFILRRDAFLRHVCLYLIGKNEVTELSQDAKLFGGSEFIY